MNNCNHCGAPYSLNSLNKELNILICNYCDCIKLITIIDVTIDKEDIDKDAEITVYHGTTLKAWENIKKVGFEPNHDTGLNTNMFPQWENESTGLWVSDSIKRAKLHCSVLYLACGKMNTSPVILSWKTTIKNILECWGKDERDGIYYKEYLIKWDIAKKIDVCKIYTHQY